MSLFFHELVVRAGNRFDSWAGKAFLAANGLINWPALGIYDVSKVTNGVLEETVHRPTGDIAKVPSVHHIKVPFGVGRNWSDTDAYILKDDTPIIMAKWFDEGKGPNNVQVLKANANIDIIVKAAIDANTANMSKVVSATSTPEKAIGADAIAAKRQATMKKARAALDAKQTELGRQRTFEIK